MEKKSTLWPVVALVAIAVAAVALMAYIASPKSPYSQTALAGLAQALAAKGVTMYGAAWCPHCKAQKALFGDAFKYVPYVECPENQELCIAKGVQGYPTWIAKDGARYEGEQSIDALSRIAGYTIVKQ